MIHIYYGFGKGKTSTLNGSLLRAQGAGLNPIVFRFLKGRATSEDKVINSLNIPIFSNHPYPKFVIEMNPDEKQHAKKNALEQLQLVVKKANNYDFIILDELLDIVYLEFITEQELIDILNKFSKNHEILISGHYKLQKIFKIADLITYYDPEKHYFKKQKARKGIEF